MASIKNLKKDINYVLGDVIEYALNVANSKNDIKLADSIIDEAIDVFDSLIDRVNAKYSDSAKVHFKQVKSDLEKSANTLIDKINSL